uniref:Uncharacterized protein n=1 Tax=Aegilops tauschii subsp. strangulata TaxID=200361 RepID=A0A453E0Q3_AEGTS
MDNGRKATPHISLVGDLPLYIFSTPPSPLIKNWSTATLCSYG